MRICGGSSSGRQASGACGIVRFVGCTQREGGSPRRSACGRGPCSSRVGAARASSTLWCGCRRADASAFGSPRISSTNIGPASCARRREASSARRTILTARPDALAPLRRGGVHGALESEAASWRVAWTARWAMGSVGDVLVVLEQVRTVQGADPSDAAPAPSGLSPGREHVPGRSLASSRRPGQGAWLANCASTTWLIGIGVW